MRTRGFVAGALALIVSTVANAQGSFPGRSGQHDAGAIERLTGAKGAPSLGDGVFRVAVPRTDLRVTVAGVQIPPAMGLTSWTAFQRASDGQDMVMGDLVLTEDQVNPVMDVALGNGLEVTALHDHFLWDTPKVMFMHISGTGDEAALAKAVGKVFARIKETAGSGEKELPAPVLLSGSGLDTARLDSVFHAKGTLSDGVYKVVVGRGTTMNGDLIGSAMGVNTWAAFAGSDDAAVVDGDFAVLESELQAVLASLRASGINIAAIHQHMTGEQPRMMFLHYWGTGRAERLARSLAVALERTAARQQ